jgi:hypothetical protein
LVPLAWGKIAKERNNIASGPVPDRRAVVRGLATIDASAHEG